MYKQTPMPSASKTKNLLQTAERRKENKPLADSKEHPSSSI